jgi:hypothetical protein
MFDYGIDGRVSLRNRTAHPAALRLVVVLKRDRRKWERMYSVETDEPKSLIIISAAGVVTVEQVRAAAAQVREVMQDAPPGIRVVADFRFLERMDATAAPHIGEIMDALAAKQVALVVRIMPDLHKDIGLNILSQFHYGPGIQILTVATLADALDSIRERPID